MSRRASCRRSCGAWPRRTGRSVSFAVVDDGRVLYGASDAFEYKPLMVVSGLSPPRGGTGGGTVVAVEGSGFLAYASSVTCAFGDAPAASVEVVSATLLRCVAPAHAEGSVAVRVGAAGDAAVGAASDATYGFVAEPAAISAHPGSGARSGGEPITVYGSNFVDASELSCRFGGSALSDARWVSATELDWGASSASFAYLAGDVAYAVTPASGPAAGGTEVTVGGADFQFTAELACRFSNDETYLVMAAAFVDASTIRCVAPTWAGRETVVMALSSNGVDFTDVGAFAFEAPATLDGIAPTMGSIAGGTAVELRGSNFPAAPSCFFGDAVAEATLACVAPAHDAGAVVLALSGNGLDFVDVAEFAFWPEAVVLGARPAFGGVSGGTVVALAGANFPVDAGDVACLFGDVPAAAVDVVSASEVRCESPAAAAGTAKLSLSFNGAEARAGVDLTYRYVAGVLLGQLEPASGPAAGGTVVAVSGLNIPDSTDLRCRFGALDVDARWISSTEAECVAPAAAAPGAVAVRLGVADQQMSADALEFVYAAALDLAAASPLSGPANGGTVVAIEGSGFRFSTLLYCRFGWTEVAATFVSETEIRCASPSGESGPATLSVSNNKQDYVDLASSFVYEVSPVVASIAPDVGAVAGGTAVTILGSGFEDVTLCLFGDEAIPATVASATEVRCTAPAAAAGAVAVGVSINGADAYAGTSQYRYVAVPEVLSLEPASGGVAGGGTVIVRGLNFADSSLLACRFGTATAPARWVNSTELECEAPAGAAGDVAVEVSVNGADFTDDGATFSYLATAVVSGVSPASGPSTGGTEVTVTGSDLAFSTTLACRFAFVDVAASFVSSSELRCVAPAHGAGSVSFAVVDDGRVLYGASDAFEYKPLMVVSGLSPPRGGTGGGTVVAVEGSGFLAYASSVTCAFGDAPAASVEVVSATLLRDATYGFVAEPAAISAHPGSGARSGGEPITVYGSNFVDASELSCRFGGSALSDARWVSATELVCASPAGAGTVRVEVTVNGRDWGASSASFAYLAGDVTYAVTPASGPAAGGAELAIAASSPAAFDGADARCRFGVVDVAATRGGDGALACVAPALDAGAYALTVVVEDAPRASLTYEAFDALAATFAPLLGPTTGGTAVAVDAPDVAGLCCFFDDVAAAVDASSKACAAPPHLAGDVVLSVAPCALGATAATTSSTATYVYHEPVEVFNVFPRVFSASTRGEILVVGAHFVDSPALACSVYGAAQAARFISSSRLACSPPPVKDRAYVASMAAGLANTGVGAVRASNNGFDYSASSSDVKVAPNVVLNYAVPSIVTASTATLDVSGSGFLDDFADSVMCVYDGALVEDAFHRFSNRVECAVPPGGRVANVTVCYETSGCAEFALDLAAADAGVSFTGAAPDVADVAGGAVVTFDVANLDATRRLRLFRTGFDDAAAVDFAFAPRPTLVAATPAVLPESGGLVKVAGGDFDAGLPVYCDFSGSFEPASVLSATEIACLAPPRRGDADVVLRVGHAKSELSAAAVVLDYFHPATLFEASPAVGVLAGGTEVAITGTNLDAFDATNIAPLCRFGESTTAYAQVVSKNEIRCVSPGWGEPGPVDLWLSLNDGFHFSLLPGAFTYVDKVHVDSAALREDDTNTTVVVEGAGFLDAPYLSHCVIDDTVLVEITALTDDRVECDVDASVVAAAAVVALSAGALDAVSNKARVVARARAVVASVDVRGDVVVLRGAHFPNVEDLACDYGDDTHKAAWVSSSRVECPLPSGAENATVALVGGGRAATMVADAAVSAAHRTTVSSVERATTARGVESVRALGTNFDAAREMLCIFDGRAWRYATHVSENAVECPLPPAGTSSVSVLSEGVPRLENASLADAALAVGDAPVVAAYAPARGPAVGGATVALRGVFDLSRGLYCHFGGVGVAATIANTTTAACVSPPSAGESCLLTFSYDAAVAGSEGVAFAFFHDVEARSASPAAASAAGGATVTVAGANFPRDAALACAFGDVAVDAVWVSAAAVLCVAPPLEPGTVELRVVRLGDAAAGPSVPFVALPDPHANALLAPFAPAIAGGDVVAVAGVGFEHATAEAACRFGDRVVAAAADGAFRCVAPRLAATGHVRLALSNDGATFFGDVPLAFDAAERRGFADLVVASETTAEGSLVLTVDADPASDLACYDAVTGAEADVAGDSCAFPASLLRDDVVICVVVDGVQSRDRCGAVRLGRRRRGAATTAATPARVAAGEDGGAETARAHGGLFVNSKKLCCAWDGVPAAATWISSYAVDCAVPARGPGVALLTVENDCGRPGASGANVTFVARSLLSSLTPSSLAFEESGAVVRISGNASGDAFGLPVACDFGGLETRADVLDGDVYCATPAAPAGAPRTVDVTVLEHEAIAARFEGAEITFAAAPRVDAVVPRSAPVAGSAALTVLGDFPAKHRSTAASATR
ncbi:hypothetical protein JL721_6130 [Aureococcus anophagefferens]|nr:hypothetical protein JL721_6130 [Aureococcus anophagefferens]